jgi:hypothetical protein
MWFVRQDYWGSRKQLACYILNHMPTCKCTTLFTFDSLKATGGHYCMTQTLSSRESNCGYLEWPEIPPLVSWASNCFADLPILLDNNYNSIVMLLTHPSILELIIWLHFCDWFSRTLAVFWQSCIWLGIHWTSLTAILWPSFIAELAQYSTIGAWSNLGSVSKIAYNSIVSMDVNG